MALFSWFNSSDQVDTALVCVAAVGAVIELGVAVAAVINVHKEIKESRKKKLEKYIEIFACVAAFFFLAEAILGWRSSMLLEKELETLKTANLKHEQQVEELRKQNDEHEAKEAELKQQIAQTSTNVANIDPLNQPIASLTASVSLMNLGTNRTNIDPSKPLGGAVFVKLRFGCSKHPEKGWIAELTCASCVNNVLFPAPVDSTNIIGSVWLLEFSPSGMGHFTSVIPPKANVRDANEWDAVEFDAPFLPPETEIFGGVIKLTINSTEKRFEIPPQKIQKAEKIPPTEEQKAQGITFLFRSPAITNTVTVISW